MKLVIIANPLFVIVAVKNRALVMVFVYKDDDAHAIYYAAWSSAHTEKKVSFAIAIGEWNDESTSDDRTCFGLEAYEGKEEILFHVIEPEQSPWADTELLGKMLSRKESLLHPLLKELFIIVEFIVRNHMAVCEYFSMKTENKSFTVKH